MSYDDIVMVPTDRGLVALTLGEVCDAVMDTVRDHVAHGTPADKARTVVLLEWSRPGAHPAPLACRLAPVSDLEREWSKAAPLMLGLIYRALQAGQTPVVFDDGIAAPRGAGMSVSTMESYMRLAPAPWEAPS